MSYQQERDEFITRMAREGLPVDVTRLLLREATGLNRRAELACSSEAADRDRVPCPASKGTGPCLCDSADQHEKPLPTGWRPGIPRITLQDWQAEQRVRKALAEMDKNLPADAPRWTMETQGDPRGCVLRIIPPSYAERNKGRDRGNLDAIGVPAGPSGIRW